MAVGYLGIDWGTHSSKWCYQDGIRDPVVGPIWDSAVWRQDDWLSMHWMDHRYRGQQGEQGLKRKLIWDPDQPFWTGERPKLGVTLGEATVFSLCGLLLDAKRSLREKGVDLASLEALTVRFAHPNWITLNALLALRYFRDAAALAASVLLEEAVDPTENGVFQMPVAQLRERAQSGRRYVDALSPFPIEYEHQQYLECSRGEVQGVRWQLVFESCAAGFSYLIEAEPDVFDIDDPDYSTAPRVRKLLVVDIGAGSTDAGYMLRTVQRDPRTQQQTRPLLLWLPAAAAHEMGGRWLTDQILGDWAQAGRAATFEEAEDYKTSGVAESWERPYVKEWCSSIAERVSRYMESVPDDVRLPEPPPLDLIVTGGSSAVQPVVQHLCGGVERALAGRCAYRQVRHLRMPTGSLRDRGYDEVTLAQLAVCVGASHPQMADLKHRHDLRQPRLASAGAGSG